MAVSRGRPASDPSDAGEARAAALRLLGRSSHSRRELARRLGERGFDSRAVAGALEGLARAGLLDDRKAAESFVLSRRSRTGRERLRRELAARGFSADDAEAALSGVEPDGEREAARRLLERKSRGLAGASRETRRRRLYAALRRRGFSVADARALLDDGA